MLMETLNRFVFLEEVGESCPSHAARLGLRRASALTEKFLEGSFLPSLADKAESKMLDRSEREKLESVGYKSVLFHCSVLSFCVGIYTKIWGLK